jgi:hypothetical protein
MAGRYGSTKDVRSIDDDVSVMILLSTVGVVTKYVTRNRCDTIEALLDDLWCCRNEHER